MENGGARQPGFGLSHTALWVKSFGFEAEALGGYQLLGLDDDLFDDDLFDVAADGLGDTFAKLRTALARSRSAAEEYAA